MNRSKNIKKFMLLTIVIVAVVSVVGVSYAAWANKLNADKVFEIKAAEVTHLNFGGQGDIALSGLAEPGMTLSSVATIKTTNATLDVKFTLASLEVKTAGSDAFEKVAQADANLFTLTVEGANNNTMSIGKEEMTVTFKFAMRATNVDTDKYPSATFRLTVTAVGSIPR